VEEKTGIKADVSESTNKILLDLVSPSSIQVGKALGNIASLLNNDYFEKIKDILEEEIKSAKYAYRSSLVVEKSYYEVTAIGETFIKACTNK
jgi:hypothetical protein